MSSRQERAVAASTPRGLSNADLDQADIVVVGNGIAGLTAALEARTLAPDKRIVVITNQIHPTINTPALKQFAIGKLEREQLLAFPAGTERSKRIHIVTADVKEIHAKSKYVTLDGNRGFGYGSLLIATGSFPQGLPAHLPGRNFDGVLTLHRLQDYMDLRRRLSEVSEAVVVGGGVHAIETVMGLRYWGMRVHWLIRGSTFMRNILDAESSNMVLEHIRHKGIIVHTETEIVGIVGRVAMVAGVVTNQQEMIPCQLVISCTGTQPMTNLADRSSIPIKHKHGIIVDDKLRSSVRDIYAAGDVAALRNPQTGQFEPRAQWYAATFQGRIAGAMLAGRSDLALQPFGVQWHATHLGDLSMLTVGEPLRQGDNIVTLTDTSQGEYRRITIVDNRLIGYLSLGNKQPDSLAIKHIIDEEYPIRNITKALLKGNFDARQYISKARSRAAEGIISPRKKSAQMEEFVAERRSQPLPPPLPPASQPIPEPLAPLPSTDKLLPVAAAASQPEYIQEDNSFNPFTGNLPGIEQHLSEETTVAATNYEQLIEEFNPFTGNLPFISQPMVDTTPPDEETIRQTNPRGLWAYSAKVPAAKQTPDRNAGEYAGHSDGKRNLWSYSQQNTPARGGNGR